MPDHRPLLLARAGQEPRRVHEHDQRQTERVAGAHEARCLLRGCRVEHAAEVARLAGDDPHRPALQPGEGTHHVAGVPRRDLQQPPCVDERARNDPHVVYLARPRRHRAIRGVVGGRHRGGNVGLLAAVLREEVEQLAREQRRLHLARGRQMADAVALVNARAPERDRIELLAGDLGDDGRAGQEHPRARAHDHEVVEGGAVGGAARSSTAYDGELGHEPRQAHVLAEDPPVAGEARQPLLHARARRLDEAHHGHARAMREPQHLRDALRMRTSERSAEEGGVLRVAAHLAAVHARVPDEHPVAGARALTHPRREDACAKQPQRSGIGERLQALERRELLVRALGEGERHVPSRHSTALCPPKPKEFESASGARPLTASARARPGT